MPAHGTADSPTFISVLLPAYNVERFLDDAVESVRAQTHANWEIVAVDDCSPDGTHERLLSWWRDSAHSRFP